MSDDLYGILNISKDANPQEIRKSYLKLAFKHHPDKNASTSSTYNDSTFKNIQNAYEVTLIT